MVLAQMQTGRLKYRIEDPEISPHSYSHLSFDKVPAPYVGEKTFSSINGAGKTTTRSFSLVP
jgi:hypothetical protein